MKKKKIAAYLCMAIMLAATGCGSMGESSARTEVSPETDAGAQNRAGGDTGSSGSGTSDTAQENTVQEDAGQENAKREDTVQEEAADRQAETALDGIVVSVGDNSIEISEMVSEYAEIDGASMWTASEGDNVTVYFSEHTQFEFRTVKNNGVNGDADVESREGSFAEIREGSTLNMTGSYQGDIFYAEQVIIYSFV